VDWGIRQVILQDEATKLKDYNDDDIERFYAKLDRLDEAQDEARSVVSVDVDRVEIMEKSVVMSRIFREYHEYVDEIRKSGASKHSIKNMQERSLVAIRDTIATIQCILSEYDSDKD